MKVGVYTLGCRLNVSESEELVRFLEKKSLPVSLDKPELIVVRGCSVTQKAEKETILKIRKLRKNGPKNIIIAAGCVSDKFVCAETDFILPKKQEKKLPDKLIKIFLAKNSQVKKNKKVDGKIKLRTRAFIKIQDGCNNFCAYCIVPYLRNKKISIGSTQIIKQIKDRINNGYQEVILTGVNIGQWREKNRNLIWLIKEILNKTAVTRLRISSLWPEEANDELVGLFEHSRLARHLHLSLQSFSSSVLRRMGRFYQLEKIIEQLKKIREKFSDLSLSADLIVGFPGETEKEFQETFKKIKQADFFKLHVFRYSSRSGTAAASMKNQVDEKIKRARSKKLLLLSEHLNEQWRRKFLSREKKVLFEQNRKNLWQGFTDNYLKVFVKSRENLANRILTVKLVKLYQDGIFGRLITKKP